MKPFRVISKTFSRPENGSQDFYDVDLELSPTATPPVEQHYTDTQGFGCFLSQWPTAAPAEDDLLVSLGVWRGYIIPDYDSTNTPISNTGTVDATCSSPEDLAGTEWSLVTVSGTSSFQIVAPSPGSPDIDNPGDAMMMAYKYAAAGESRKNRWRTAAVMRSHYLERSGFTGAPTVLVKLQGYQSTNNELFVSPDLPTPGAGTWFFGYASNLTGPADGPYPNSSMSIVAPAVLTTQGWVTDGYHPYSVMGYLDTIGAGTDHITLHRTPGSGWIHDGAAWLAVFFPAA